MISKIPFDLYAKLHREFMDAKLLKHEFIDETIIEIKNTYEKLEQKYKDKQLSEWTKKDLQNAIIFIQQLSCFFLGINVAEKIVQKTTEL